MDNVLKSYVAGSIVGLIGGVMIAGLPLGWKLDDQHRQLESQHKTITEQQKCLEALRGRSA